MKLRLTADQFDNFVFEQVARSAPQNDKERMVGLRLMPKLTDPEITDPVSGDTRGPYAQRTLTVEVHEFDVDRAELELIAKRVKAHQSSVAMIALPLYQATLDAIAAARKGDS